jgi:spore coat polysaccharide biosynthesis protein SpsF (cytidylyltransferase family)
MGTGGSDLCVQACHLVCCNSNQELDMSYTSLDEAQVKELFKQAILELFEERRDLLYDLFAEVIEDFALVNAIKEGESTESVSRAEVFQILEGAP